MSIEYALSKKTPDTVTYNLRVNINLIDIIFRKNQSPILKVSDGKSANFS